MPKGDRYVEVSREAVLEALQKAGFSTDSGPPEQPVRRTTAERAAPASTDTAAGRAAGRAVGCGRSA